MKRKILLLAVMVAVLSCLFVLSVSAQTVTYEGQEIELVNNLGDPSWYTGNTALAIQDKESIVILKDADGNMIAYPSYYILRFGVDMKNGVPSNVYVLWEDQNGVDYSFVNEKMEKEYAYGSVYYIEFPYGMTQCKNNRLFGRENGGAKEVNCVEIVLPDSVNNIEGQAFRMMDSCKKINIPAAVTSFPSWTFSGSTKLETVEIAEGSLIESIGNSFSSCKALSSINLEACTKLKSIGNDAFSYCTSLREIALPDSVETIGAKAFYKIGDFGFASDYLPKSLKSITSHFLSGCNVINEVLYFPEGFTDFSGTFHFNDGFTAKTELTLVFLGKMTNVNMPNAELTGCVNYGSKKPMTIVFAQNAFDELNGTFLQGVDYNGTFGYIYSKGDGTDPYTVKENGTLTFALINNDPNTENSLGTTENGDKLYKAENAPANIIFCGGETVEQCYSVRTNDAGMGWFRFFTTERTYDIDAHKTVGVHYNSIVHSAVNCGYDETTTKTCVICKEQSVEIGAIATGNHTYEDDFNCETALTCDVCEKTLSEALTHILKTEIVYANGSYDKNGAKTVTCENEGCTVCNTSEPTAPLFVISGFSNSASGIMYNYIVNHDAIDNYRAHGGTIYFGVVVAIGDVVSPLNADGSLTEGTKGYASDLTERGNDLYEIAVKGIPAEHLATSLVCCGYITDGTTLHYMGATALESAATPVTLEALIALTPAETKEEY